MSNLDFTKVDNTQALPDITHPELVKALVKNPYNIRTSLSDYTADLWHGATGVAGEAGELMEAILFPGNQEVDYQNVIEELGDLYFYIEQICQRAEIVLDWDTIQEAAYNQPVKANIAITHAASVGVHGAQILDTIKKAAIYNQELNVELLENQIHALCASMQVICICASVTRDDCLQANITKLSKRYASLTYSDQGATERADKAGAN